MILKIKPNKMVIFNVRNRSKIILGLSDRNRPNAGRVDSQHLYFFANFLMKHYNLISYNIKKLEYNLETKSFSANGVLSEKIQNEIMNSFYSGIPYIVIIANNGI